MASTCRLRIDSVFVSLVLGEKCSCAIVALLNGCSAAGSVLSCVIMHVALDDSSGGLRYSFDGPSIYLFFGSD